MQENIDIKELFEVLWKRAWLIAIAALAGLGLAYSISVYIIRPRYSSYISLHVNNSPEMAGTINLADINAAQRLVNTYIEILQDPDVIDELGDRLLMEYDELWLANFLPVNNGRIETSALRRVINMSSANNTEVLRIRATTHSPYLSARIVTIMSEIAPDVLTRVVRAGSVEVIGATRIAESPTSPNIFLNSVLGFFAGMALATGFILMANMLDNRVRNDLGLMKRYNIPIIGEIPDFHYAKKKGTAYYGE